MEKALTMQSLATPATGLQRAQRTPVASASTTDPPVRGTRQISGSKPALDSVSISNEARRMEANSPPPGGNTDRLQGPRSGDMPARGMEMLEELKQSFFTREGEDGFNARVDFNSDGVINVQDLGVLKEKIAGYGPRQSPSVESEPEAEPAPVATLDSIRNSFFTNEGDEDFDAASDLNGDGVINVQDLGLFRLAQGDTAQPVQPVPAALNGSDGTAAVNTATSSIQSAQSEPSAGTVIEDPAPSYVEPVVESVNGLTVNPDTVGLATSANAGNAPAVEVASVRESLLSQLRDTLFSRQSDERVNVADFLSVRESV